VKWLEERPKVDFYIYRDGEIPFSRLVGTLLTGLGVAKVKKQKLKYECPSCNKVNVKRLSKGIWLCNTCSNKFTGKAYTPY